MTTTSAVIVTYNSSRTISGCVRSAREAVDRVVVVDNASRDDSAELAQLAGADVVVRMEVNVGFGSGVNHGVRHAETDHILVLNPDAYLTVPAVDQLHRRLRSSPSVGLVGPRLIGSDGAVQASARPFPTLSGLAGTRTPLGRLNRGLHRRGEEYLTSFLDVDHPSPVPWLLGAVMLLRRDLFEAVGGFDDRYFLYGEDVDLCVRIWRSGHSVVLDPTVAVVHEYAQASSRRFELRNAATRHHWRSMMRLAMSYPRYFFLGDFESRIGLVAGVQQVTHQRDRKWKS